MTIYEPNAELLKQFEKEKKHKELKRRLIFGFFTLMVISVQVVPTVIIIIQEVQKLN